MSNAVTLSKFFTIKSRTLETEKSHFAGNLLCNKFYYVISFIPRTYGV